MANGWAPDGAVQDQIDATIMDAVLAARSHLPSGVGSSECDLCGGEIRRGDRYYRVAGENVCRKCLADFAAQILAVYEVRGGEER